MSVYNAELSVGKSIKSILDQSFKNFEFLIIDDCSTDNSYEIMKEFNDQRIKIIKNKKLLKDNKIHLVTLNPTLDVAQKRDKLRSSESQFNVPVSLDLVQQDRMARWKILQESVLTLSGIGLWIDNSTMTIEETVSYILKNKEKCIVK